MNFKAFFLLLAALFLVLATSFLIVENYQVLKQGFMIYRDLVVPVYVVIAASFGLGLIISFVWVVLSGLRHALQNWQTGRKQRVAEALEMEYGRGIEEILSGRLEEALGHFRAVLERDSRHRRALLRSGEVERRLGHHAAAIELHLRAHHLDEDDVAPLYLLADDHAAAGDWQRAESCLRGIIERRPKVSLAAYRRLRDLYMRQEKWTEAEALQARIRTWTAKERSSPEEENLLLGIQYQIGLRKKDSLELKEAAADFRKILKQAPAFIPACLALGETYLLGESHESALEIWEKGFLDTNSPVFLVRIADFLLEQEDPERAIEIHRRLAARARNKLIARFMTARLFYRLEMIDEAQEVLEQLREPLGHSPTLYYMLGRIYQRRGDPEGAAEAYRQVIRETRSMELHFGCTKCGEPFSEWHDRCRKCGAWSTIEVEMKENIPLEALGLSTRPVYLPDEEEQLQPGERASS